MAQVRGCGAAPMGVRVSVLRRRRRTGRKLVSLSMEGLRWRGAGPRPRLTCAELLLGLSSSGGEARSGDKRGSFPSVGGCSLSSLVHLVWA